MGALAKTVALFGVTAAAEIGGRRLAVGPGTTPASPWR